MICRVGRGLLAGLLAATLLASPALAHVGALGGAGETGEIPFALVVLTGGGVVGASFMFTTLMTDHATIRAVNGWGISLPRLTPETLTRLASGLGIVGLVAVVLSGLFGPREPPQNLAILLVWVGWWAGYTMSVYLVGNTWPAIDPWRTLAGLLPSAERSLSDAAGWVGVAALLGLVWLEVVSPVSRDPRLLAAVVVGYTVVTLGGVARYGRRWFDRVDPLNRVFRWYGRAAPLRRTGDGLAVGLPGSGLVEPRDSESTGADSSQGALETTHRTAFVLALLWVTTYDGLVSTPAWGAVARPFVAVGVPALGVYLAAILGGYALFLYAYQLAAHLSRRTAGSYVTVGFIRRRFIPSLVPIAVGYHLAHFLGYFLELFPALAGVLANPLTPPAEVARLALPGWFAGVQLMFVVLGHMLAVWIAHAIAFETFTGRLQPIRSQYPFVLVMIFYTMTSMWVVAQPFTPPPYV